MTDRRPPSAPPAGAEPTTSALRTVHTMRHGADTVALPRVHLTVEREGGKEAQRVVVFDGDVCRIGSHASNDLVLNDKTVSRFHCRLVREKQAWRVADQGSTNGTYVDNVRVRDGDVNDGTALHLGDSTVRVYSGEPERDAELANTPVFGSLAGTSMAMRRLYAMLQKVAASDINVLIHGESGTGKELVATEIVQRSPRVDKPFVIVDCGAISPNLVESELFGHVRGAFTGADRDRVGAFEAAEDGTVFLDEIGELPLELQPKLLRALEAREIRRVGETRPRKINVRVISATNRELEREVNKGRFREDLYFRLAVITVNVPPLRERLEDLLILIRVFLGQLGVPEQERLFPPPVVEEMARHEWPGNVRELRNYVERTVVLQAAASFRRGVGGSGAPASSPNITGQGPVDARLPFKIAKDQVIEEFERGYLGALLEAAGGNMSKAARTAGMDRMYLHRLVQKHGLRGPGSGK